MKNKISSLLGSEKRLGSYINELQKAAPDEIVEGAFQWLVDAEAEMMHQRANLENKFCMSCQFGKHCGFCDCCN